MELGFDIGDSPIPGYTILADLGRERDYRIFKVRTPDGSARRWKLIDLVRQRGNVEVTLLPLMRSLQNPGLNVISAVHELEQGTKLALESELHTGTLRERLKQAQEGGAPRGQGIPPVELIRYFERAAEGIDYLTTPQHVVDGKKVAVYHRALRPECMLLFDEKGLQVCRVSDFGLSKIVAEAGAAPHSQGMQNYEYVAPELIEGSIAASSDQYSLASCYYELRTGELPFPGAPLQQIQNKLSDRPHLDLVSPEEQLILRKALSANPANRYPSCKAFVAELKQAVSKLAASPPPPPAARPSTPVINTPPRTSPPPPASAIPPPVVPVPPAVVKPGKYDPVELETTPAQGVPAYSGGSGLYPPPPTPPKPASDDGPKLVRTPKPAMAPTSRAADFPPLRKSGAAVPRPNSDQLRESEVKAATQAADQSAKPASSPSPAPAAGTQVAVVLPWWALVAIGAGLVLLGVVIAKIL